MLCNVFHTKQSHKIYNNVLEYFYIYFYLLYGFIGQVYLLVYSEGLFHGIFDAHEYKRILVFFSFKIKR